jgi:NTP pyrophosphatase (non-canonical NTP hydrolase)
VVDPLGGKQYGGFNQPTIPLPGTVEELIEILDGLNVPNRPKEVQQ